VRGAPETFIGMLDGKTFGKLIVRIGPDDAKQQDIDLIKGVSHAAVATDGFW
jgi:hypothetical protein